MQRRVPARRDAYDEGGAVKKVMMGNHAVSWGVQLSRAEVISAYPITPQTQIVETFAKIVADGEADRVCRWTPSAGRVVHRSLPAAT